MSTISVYYPKGAVTEDLITSVFDGPEFAINEVEFGRDRTDTDLMLADVLDQARTEPDKKKTVFVHKLADSGREAAREFIADVLDDSEKIVVVDDGDFSAVAVPRSKVDTVIGNIDRGVKILRRQDVGAYVETTAINRNVMTVLIFVAIALLFVAAMKVKTPVGGLLLALAAFLIFAWVVFAAA